MVGDSWRNATVGAFEAGLLARWVDREGRASHARRFIAARELGDAYPDLLRAGQMTELELVRSGINANFDYLHAQRWAFQPAQLRQILTDASEKEKAAAERALDDHFDTRDRAETSRARLMRTRLRLSPHESMHDGHGRRRRRVFRLTAAGEPRMGLIRYQWRYAAIR
jgi:hypothetical protein